MKRRPLLKFLGAFGTSLAVGGASAFAADSLQKSQKKDSAEITVEGPLGSLGRELQGGGPISATVRTGGGELFLDCSHNKAAREELDRLWNKYMQPGSMIIILVRVAVQGKLKSRPSKIVGEQGKLMDGPPQWVIVVESMTVSENAT
ncbi:MAG: hypothetical protein H8F28_21305 [Fibrella sp.]|nr:hypothetical protein [Armatimonadota bacterium]